VWELVSAVADAADVVLVLASRLAHPEQYSAAELAVVSDVALLRDPVHPEQYSAAAWVEVWVAVLASASRSRRVHPVRYSAAESDAVLVVALAEASRSHLAHQEPYSAAELVVVSDAALASGLVEPSLPELGECGVVSEWA
jgi:hypothetical protein